jgi:hypothetical protein
VFTVYTNDFVRHDNATFIGRVTAEDLYSEVEDKNKITDQFTIELRDECHDIIILENGSNTKIGNIAISDSATKQSGSGTEASPWMYHTWQ